jgi:hypothetical protein
MSRTYCFLTNKSAHHPVVVTGFRGSDWISTDMYVGTAINPGENIEIGAMGDPARGETDHWGWIYLLDQRLQLPLQVYLRIAFGIAKDEVEASAGIAAPQASSEGASNPAPWPDAFEVKRGDAYIYDPLPRHRQRT